MRTRLLLLTLLACLSSLAFATSIDEKLYNALNTTEVPKTPGGQLGSGEKEKRSGSLVCTKTLVVRPNAIPSYKCSLVNGSDNDLYNALNVPEVDITPVGLLGSRQTEKRVGNEFSCKRVGAVRPNQVPQTTCGFIYKSAPAPTGDSNSSSEATN